LRSVSSSIRTKTCEYIIESILNGVTDLKELSELCLGKLKKKKEEIEKAVKGSISPGDKEILKLLQEDRRYAQKQLVSVNEKILKMEQTHYTLSGIGSVTAQQIIAEL
jgi:transposase